MVVILDGALKSMHNARNLGECLVVIRPSSKCSVLTIKGHIVFFFLYQKKKLVLFGYSSGVGGNLFRYGGEGIGSINWLGNGYK